MKNFGKIGTPIIALVAILLIPRLASELATSTARPFGHFDTDGVFLWVSLHHLWQLILTVLLMLVLHAKLSGWGFTLNNRERSFYLFGQFFLYYTGFVVAGHLALYFLAPPPNFGHPLSAKNVIGELGFKLLLSGTAEEPLFRGFVMLLLYQSYKGNWRLGNIEIPVAGLIATAYFMIAHLGYTVWPFSITFFSPMQQLQALALGLYYAVLFHQTRSLLAPILVHNYFNFSLTGLGMLWALFG